MALNLKEHSNDLLFIPLGGSNEIGMNLNLYGYQGQWIIADLGIGFANDYLPGVEVIVPDIEFLSQIKDKILGIVLTHAHEDHFGAVPYLWDEIRVPVYATPFTSALLKLKLAEDGMRGRVDIKEVKAGSTIQLGPFGVEMVQLTHSIPEMQALAIHTEKGVVFHTGDWKFDANPQVGPASNEARLAELGEKGVLAVVCDSTNVFVEGESGSEEGVRERLVKAIAACENRVVVTTFASNVARVDSIVHAAKLAGRAVVLAGRSLWRVTEAAKEAGYLQDAPPFLTEKEAMDVPKDKVLILCTGCQGEPRAALPKMARGEHHALRLAPGDTVIYSARKIPGNELKIGYTQNKLVEMGVEVQTDDDLDVHVSGHPARDELIKLYNFLKPKIAIPVHGEVRHIHEHAKLARSLGVPNTIEVRNGHVLKLANDEVRFIGTVPSGYTAIDGITLLPTDSPVLRMRRKLRDDGAVFVAIAVDDDWQLTADPRITAPGSLDSESDADLIDAMEEAVVEAVEGASKRNVNTKSIQDAVRQAVRRITNNELGKKPVVEVLVLKV
jgi:ribonuclease J